MFQAFFPRPKVFFSAAIIWITCNMLVWHLWGHDIGRAMGLDIPIEEPSPVIGLGYFVTPDFLLFYAHFALASLGFGLVCRLVSNNEYVLWSALVSALLLFLTNFSVQVSVAINHWRRPFFDSLQTALTSDGSVSIGSMYKLFIQFSEIAVLAITLFMLVRFVASHYVFRWRQAMNNYYVRHWQSLRGIEGASQRVQEDTMRFAGTVERLGVSLADSVMTLIAFLPILWTMSEYVTEIPILGEIPHSLFYIALIWAVFGTAFLAIIGYNLPGLQFVNQKVEAAYRKELVYGEDDESRAHPLTLSELFTDVRSNYFRLYFHYTYFNLARSLYINVDNVFAYVILMPTIVSGTITYGILQQILTAFGQVSNSFQYLVRSWPTIIELMSVYKRLRTFEEAIENDGEGGEN